MKIVMPENANRIIKTLQAAGYEAYIVGGCVRDALLGRDPDDWDITTSAKPLEVKKLFKRTVDTGLQHGTVTVLMDKEAYEVTTYRVDGKYTDHRRPDSVTFTASLIEDMKRRDFTINAMAYNDDEGVVDNFDGIKDLEAGVIRCVGNPDNRFDEDALRILRAIRFSAQLSFEIDSRTRESMIKKAEYLKDISAERIHVELTKLLLSNNPAKLIEAYEIGITKIVLPEFDEMMKTPQNSKHHCYNVGEHTIKVIEEVPATEVMRYAALLHDVAKPVCRTTDEDGTDHFYKHSEVGVDIARDVLNRLKFDNAGKDRILRIVKWHDYGIKDKPSLKGFRRSLSKMGADLFPDYLLIKRADILGQSDYKREEKLEKLEILKGYYEEIMAKEQCLTIKDLKIDGKDLMGLGMTPGKAMGEVLKYLLDHVLDNPEDNNEETLKKLAADKIADGEL